WSGDAESTCRCTPAWTVAMMAMIREHARGRNHSVARIPSHPRKVHLTVSTGRFDLGNPESDEDTRDYAVAQQRLGRGMWRYSSGGDQRDTTSSSSTTHQAHTSSAGTPRSMW